MNNERIVLCRPHGGLNDMLNQIEKCYQYCKKYNRKLFVDGSIGGFLDDFAHYFIPACNDMSFDKIDFLEPPFDVFPGCLCDELYDYELYRTKESRVYCTGKYGTPVTFDFEKNYEEQILVHAQEGGGYLGIYAFAKIFLKEDIKIHIKNIIEELKKQSRGGYDAIHVRNTDYRTDYKSYFAEIKDKLNKITVICTDDYETQLYAKCFFGENVKTVTNIPDLRSVAGKTLHYNSRIDRYKTNVDTLTDLFVLAYAEKLFMAPLCVGHDVNSMGVTFRVSKHTRSGFQVLAENLHNNKIIIDNMLYTKTKLLSENDLEILFEKLRNNIVSIQYPKIKIDNLQNHKLYIWGAGENAADALAQCDNNGWEIEAFLDSNPQIEKFRKYKVLRPDSLLNSTDRDFFIIISSIIYADEIAQICEHAGLKEGVDFWKPDG